MAILNDMLKNACEFRGRFYFLFELLKLVAVLITG